MCGQRREEVCYGPWVVGARIERRGGRRERRRGEEEEEGGGGRKRGGGREGGESGRKWKGRESRRERRWRKGE